MYFLSNFHNVKVQSDVISDLVPEIKTIDDIIILVFLDNMPVRFIFPWYS